MADAPLISLCIPTHEGRRAALAALLDGALEQARGLRGRVEVCISDNASQDGTAELVTALAASAPVAVRYQRQPGDLGLALNLLAVLELARGRYCWMLSSDDLLAPGALARACELLEALPGATGYVAGSIYVDAEDPRLRSRQLPRAFHPAGDEPRLIEGTDAIYDECGNAWMGLSWNLVERERCIAVARRHRELILRHPIWPQIVLLGIAARERPRWGWLGEPLVRQRNATTFLFERGGVPLADRWSALVGSLAATWGTLLGRGGARWRRRMRRLHRVWGGAADARATKLYDAPSLRAQARLVRSWAGAFWPVTPFWRETLAATLLPMRLTRALYAPDRRPLRARVLAVGQLTLAARLPERIAAGGVAIVEVTIGNTGPRVVPAAGPRAVTIGQRWLGDDGALLSAAVLGLNELACLPQPPSRSIRPRRAVCAELALLPPADPGVYRVEIAAHQHGSGWLDATGAAAALAATVTVNP